MRKDQEEITNFVIDQDLHLANIAQIITRDFYPELAKINKDTMETVPNLSLNNYLVNFRSDENETFSQLLENNNREWKERYWWCDKETRQKHMQNILMPSEASRHLSLGSGDRPKMVTAEGRNTFLFPNDEQIHDKEMEKYDKEKKVVYENTRLQEMTKPLEYAIFKKAEQFTLDGRIPETPLLHGVYDQQAKKDSRYSLGADGFRQPSRRRVVETVNGYKLLTMPSPSPNTMQSPLMTYGQIQDTPQRLPSFSIPSTPTRDLVLQQLNHKIHQKKKEDRERKQSTVTRILRSCTPGSIHSLKKRKGSSLIRKQDSITRKEGESLQGLLKL